MLDKLDQQSALIVANLRWLETLARLKHCSEFQNHAFVGHRAHRTGKLRGRHRGYYDRTSSASRRIFSGSFNPIAAAALALTTRSNFVGSSIGNSWGLAPLRMRST